MAAPIAHFDDDWPNLGDPSIVSEEGLLPQKGRVTAAAVSEAAPQSLLFGGDDDDDVLHDSSFSPRENAGFRSMEDLVNDFDEKLTTCFQNFDAKTESIAPVAVIAEDTLLEKDEKADVVLELSDDEELRDQLDMHSIIVSCIAEEPLFTAEQVIEEIEEMMQDSPDMEAEHNPSQSDLSMLSVDVQQPNSCSDYEESECLLIRTVCYDGLFWMEALSIAELNECLEETEMKIRRFSEELVQQLALRDELDFEKEVKNSFISALIDVQNRQKEYREALKKKKKLKGGAGKSQGLPEKTLGSRFSMEGISSVIQNSFRQTFGSRCSERQYLTTVIPYKKKGHPPSIEDLQILTKILQAMRDDSDKVPSLLTDYILKGELFSFVVTQGALHLK
uniref:Fasciculation and elongation protein zeta 2a n=1 Tax=Oreochromis niloticus TaxID=8128 RepID=I3JI83_ORENI